MEDTPRSQTTSTKLQRIAEQARDHPDYTFTTLAHLMDVELLREAYRRTRKDGAPGVDAVTAKEYGTHLEENLRELHARLVSGAYQATPVKRIWLEKEDGKLRPIGIPAFEDKLVERAVVMLLSAVYEQDFYDFSYGFREGHSAHQALEALRGWGMANEGGWIVDADITGFFDNLPHEQLQMLLQRRIKDGTLLRLIGKWLKAGVVDGTNLTYPDRGVPQGGVISPLLANVFLHYVLDDWFVRDVRPRLKGRATLLRFADDFVIICERREDAQRLLEVLPKRLARFGLELHPTKTQLINFQKPSQDGPDGGGKRTFDFLGFTHYWAKSRWGSWVIKRKTARKRLKRTLTAIWVWCKGHRHWPMREQHRMLSLKLRGHYQYYGIRGNSRWLNAVYSYAKKAWRYWLGNRSQKSAIPWEKFARLQAVFPLPRPKIVDSI